MSQQQEPNKITIEPDNDDAPVGRILNRREVLTLFGFAGGAMLLAGCTPTSPTANGTVGSVATATAVPATATTAATVEAVSSEIVATTLPSCVVRPELTEGPYFVDGQLDRSDIRSDPATGEVKPGILLELTFRVSEVSANACAPLAGAMVDIWHCDALGVYSGVTDNTEGFDTAGEQFLRGYQVTGADGIAHFTTIYPGWYTGRTVHIHFKIRLAAGTEQSYEFTSQLFFDESLTDAVYANEPYASKGQRDQRNSSDGIYDDQLLLTVTQTDQGYAAIFDIGLDLSDAETGQADGMSGQGPGTGGPGGGRPSGSPPDGTPPTRG